MFIKKKKNLYKAYVKKAFVLSSPSGECSPRGERPEKSRGGRLDRAQWKKRPLDSTVTGIV